VHRSQPLLGRDRSVSGREISLPEQNVQRRKNHDGQKRQRHQPSKVVHAALDHSPDPHSPRAALPLLLGCARKFSDLSKRFRQFMA